jgi:endonuclease III
MKNATKHAEQLKSLCRKLVKQHPAPERAAQEPLKALVRGAMSFDVPDKRADEAMAAIEQEFVDLNELRVATELEVQELLGQRYPQIEKRVTMITLALNNIFEREHTLSLDRLKTISRRDARNFLRELPEIHPFVEAYVMMFAFEGHTFPIDDAMLSLLRDEDIVDEDMPLEDAQKFVEHHLNDHQCYEFFTALRQSVYDRPVKATKKKARA